MDKIRPGEDPLDWYRRYRATLPVERKIPPEEVLAQPEAEQLLIDSTVEAQPDGEIARKLAVLEAIVYVTDEPLSVRYFPLCHEKITWRAAHCAGSVE